MGLHFDHNSAPFRCGAQTTQSEGQASERTCLDEVLDAQRTVVPSGGRITVWDAGADVRVAVGMADPLMGKVSKTD
ncbi:unnamed protein product [Lota lota]